MRKHLDADQMIMLPSAFAVLAIVIAAVTTVLPIFAASAALAIASIAVGTLGGGHHDQWRRWPTRMPVTASVPLRMIPLWGEGSIR